MSGRRSEDESKGFDKTSKEVLAVTLPDRLYAGVEWKLRMLEYISSCRSVFVVWLRSKAAEGNFELTCAVNFKHISWVSMKMSRAAQLDGVVKTVEQRDLNTND